MKHKSNTRLLVLGMLCEAPMHGYEIRRQLEIQRTELWADVLPGSIYHALRQMEKEKLIEVAAKEQDGNRSRAIYRPTDAGRTEFVELLREMWQSSPPSFPTSLYTLLGYMNALPKAEILKLIEKLLEEMERNVAEWEAGHEAKSQFWQSVGQEMPTYLVAIFENAKQHLKVDRQLLEQVRDELQSSGA